MADRSGGAVAVRDGSPNGALAESEGVSVKQLLSMAVERGTPVESLEKLLDLHERVAAREAAQQFVQALAAFKAELPPIVHSRQVSFTTRSGSKTNYSYTELDELARHIDPGLTKHGFSYSWDQKFDGQYVTTTCILFHVGGHSRQASFTLPTQNESAASPQQKIGMADTYASRRSLIAVLGLTTADKDPGAVEIDPTPINEDQVTELEDMITEAKADLGRFLKHFNIAAITQLPAVRYAEARAVLDEKKKRRGS